MVVGEATLLLRAVNGNSDGRTRKIFSQIAQNVREYRNEVIALIAYGEDSDWGKSDIVCPDPNRSGYYLTTKFQQGELISFPVRPGKTGTAYFILQNGTAEEFTFSNPRWDSIDGTWKFQAA